MNPLNPSPAVSLKSRYSGFTHQILQAIVTALRGWKKAGILAALVTLLAGALPANATLLLTDDFTGYTAGNLDGQGSWTKGGSGPSATVASATPLTYTGYNGGGGNYIVMGAPGSTTSKEYKAFTSTTAIGNTFYVSFLLRLTAATANASPSGNYCITLGDSSTGYGPRLFAKASGAGFVLGVSKLSNTANYGSTVFSLNTTYLVVIRYTGVAGSNNDLAYVWVNPSLSSEPSTSSAECSDTSGNDAFTTTNISNILWHNRNADNPSGAFDGVRVAAASTSAAAWTDLGAQSATPTITGAATASSFTTTYGTVSGTQTFTVSGANLTANLVATAPTGFEVSADGSTYGNTATFTQSGGNASGTLYVRLSATAPVTGSYDSQNIVLSSNGATSVNIATASSGNTVTAKALTVTANDVTKSYGNTLTGGAGSTAFTSSGLVPGESIGTVTITYGTGASAGDAAGDYANQVTPSNATGGTFTASNYSITYNSGTIHVVANPTITGAATASPFTTTYGTASAAQTFSVSGANLTADLVATAPAGYEVSNGGASYAGTATFTQTGGNASGTLYIRLAATAPAVGSYDSQNVALSSNGATSVNITTASSGNTVTAKALTITGIAGISKTYDGGVTATFSGSPAYAGLANGESFSVAGSATVAFATKTTGTGKSIAVSGFSAPSTNYVLTQPPLTADITPCPLTVTGASVASKSYDGTTAATITGATLNGVISPDVVTVSGGGTFASPNVGTGIAVTAALTLGGADAGNYSLTQPASLSADITIASQTITFAALPGRTTVSSSFALNAVASSGLPVSYSSDAPSVATVSGSIVTIVGPGTANITASQAGNGNYTAATPVSQALTISTAGSFTIFHLNDTHARITPHKWIIPAHSVTDNTTFEDVGGAAYVAGEMLALTGSTPNSLVIDGGDISEGNPIGDMGGNASMAKFYAMLSAKLQGVSGRNGRGMDAVVVGNHDVRDINYIANLRKLNDGTFTTGASGDLGMDAAVAAVPVISMNVCSVGTKTPYFNAYTIVNVNGSKVGILGYTTDAAEVGASLSSTLAVVSCDWYSSDSTKIHIRDYVNELRKNQGCNVVVLAAHVGHSSIATDTTRDGATVAALLIDDERSSGVKLPEVAVTGHWHTWTDTVWQPEMLNYKTIFTESCSYMKYIGELNVDSTGKYVGSTQHVIRDADITADTDVANFVTLLTGSYNATHTLQVSGTVGYTADNLMLDNRMKWWSADEYPWSGNNTAGQWICDAMQWKAAQLWGACDLSIEAGGGVRSDIPAGPVTFLQVYETFPWNDDTFTLIKMSGQEIVDFINKTNCDAGFSSALDVTAFDGIVTGSNVTINGSPIVLSGTYKVCINNYMYAHPPTGWTWSDKAPQYRNDILCRDGIVEFMQTQHGTPATAYTVGGDRYHLNNEFSGGYQGVVTMVDDNDGKSSYETAYVRLLNATTETLAHRGSKQVPTSLVNSDGSINQSNRLSSIELYRSYLGFRYGALKKGDIIEVWGKESAYGGNPEFVDQEGIYADGKEFNIIRHDDSQAQPEEVASITAFMNDNYKNHYVKFYGVKKSDTTVSDAISSGTITVWDLTAYATKTLPGSVGDQLVLTGVLTTETKSGTLTSCFRCDSAVKVTDLPVSTGSVTLSGSIATLSASASTPIVLGATKTISLTPVADSQVVKGKSGNNYGAGTGMYVQSSSADSYQDERAWMKFDLSILPSGANISAARLKMYCWKAAASDMPVEIRGGMDDGWFEGTGSSSGTGDTAGGITWATQPALTGSALATTTLVHGSTNIWYSWDVTNFVIDKYTGNQLASMTAKAATEGANPALSYAFESKEWSSGRPTLEVDVPNTDPAVTVAQVQFFYRYSADGNTWGSWTPVTTLTGAPWTTTFTFSNGNGSYQFYTAATDSLGNTQNSPVTNASAPVLYTKSTDVPAAPKWMLWGLALSLAGAGALRLSGNRKSKVA